MTESRSSSIDHLCVLVHGLWGNPVHLDFLQQTLKAQHPDDHLYILVAKSNADNFTYDGIEVGGERIANEVEQKIEDIEKKQDRPISKISITGYSLGGLVSRYAVGLLYKAGIFDRIQPVNFTTFATPHLGVRTPKLGYRAYVWNILGSRTLSSSGQQMFLIDNFRESGRPLLSILADPNGVFVKGLRLFKNKSLYANTINDRSVPYYTAFFSRTDPFVEMDKIDLHYLPDQEDPVILDPSDPVALRAPPSEPPTVYQRYMPTQQTMNSLPFYVLLFALMPIALPSFLANSVIQSYRSSARVKHHQSGKAGISLDRYQIPLLAEAQAVHDRVYEHVVEGQNQQYLPTPPPEPSSSSASPSPPPPPTSNGHAAGASTNPPATAAEAAKLGKRERAKEDSPFPILALTPEQFDMIEHLDAVGFRKFPVHIQRHRHTHAAIVVRMQKPGFAEGRVVVSHWASRFEV